MGSYLNISIENVKKEFTILVNNFNPILFNIDSNEFRSFKDGFFQAEGTITMWFNGPKWFSFDFYFSIGQNYTTEVATMLLLLQHYLGGIGYFRIITTTNGNKHIKYIVTNKEDIIKIVIPYFNQVYGDKKKGFIIINKIYELTKNIPSGTNYNKICKSIVIKIIILAYSLNPDGNNKKLNLL